MYMCHSKVYLLHFSVSYFPLYKSKEGPDETVTIIHVYPPPTQDVNMTCSYKGSWGASRDIQAASLSNPHIDELYWSKSECIYVDQNF